MLSTRSTKYSVWDYSLNKIIFDLHFPGAWICKVWRVILSLNESECVTLYIIVLVAGASVAMNKLN